MSPRSEEARALARRWMNQLEQDTAADPALLSRLDAMHLAEPGLQRETGISREVSDYVLEDFAETRLAVYQRYLTAEEFAFMRPHYLASLREWPALIAQVRQAREAGVAAEDERMQALARRWIALFRAYAGDDPRTQQKIRQANQQKPNLREGTWVDDELLQYLRRAVARLTA